jgi:hypothetical protein
MEGGVSHIILKVDKPNNISAKISEQKILMIFFSKNISQKNSRRYIEWVN